MLVALTAQIDLLHTTKVTYNSVFLVDNHMSGYSMGLRPWVYVHKSVYFEPGALSRVN